MKSKRSKSKTKRRLQKGGVFGLFDSSDNSSQSWGDWFSGLTNKAKESSSGLLNSANNSVGNVLSSASNSFNSTVSSASDFLNKDVSLTNTSPENNNPALTSATSVQPSISGGKRKNKHKYTAKKYKYKGGKGNLGLSYYATNVSNIKMADPTSWQYYSNGVNQYTKGGSKRRKTRKH
jgi:hypothetical protein